MTSPRFPHRPTPQPRSGLPLFALLAACLLVVLALQGVRFLYESGLMGDLPASSTAQDPFKNAGRLGQPIPLEPVLANAPSFPHNLQLGNPAATTTLTVFTDPACAACRQSLDTWLTPTVQTNARIIYKYWPQTPGNIDGGLVLELARRHNLAKPLLAQLNTTAGDLDAAAMFAALEAAGMPLADQRRALSRQSTELAALLGQDIDQGRTLRLGPPPQLVLNGYLLDGRLLTPSRLDLYVGRLFRNQPLVQASDSWLNSGN